MASIGSVSFATLRLIGDGLRGALVEALEEIERPGTDGVHRRLVGKRPSDLEYESVAGFSTAGGRRTAKISYANLVGQVLILTDDGGSIYTVIVQDVRVIEEKRVAVQVGLNGNFMVRARWKVSEL